MAGRKSDFTLPTLDDLFSTQELRDDAKLSKIRDIPLELIDDFPDHPFKVRDDEDIRVNHTLVYYNHRDEKGCYFSINTPKTKAGEREIPMTEGVKQAFLMEREFQSQAEISSKSRVDGYDDFIFVNRYGDVQNQGNLNKALRRMMRDCNDEILEKYGADSDPVLLPQFSCHILRHTFATRLCESGANLKFIQSILGHADVSTTMNIYVDVTDALKKKEITAFDDYMTTKLET